MNIRAHQLEFPNRVARSTVGQCVFAVLALVSITTLFAWLHPNLATEGLIFTLVIVLLSRVGGFVPSLVAALVAALCLAYLAPPNYSFRIDDPLDAIAVATFLITSLVIGRLVSQLRRMREEALASVNRKLIDAEERVRNRIGEELHDDIEQRLALLAVEIAQLSCNPSNSSLQLDGIREKSSTIAADVQELAYELRPYKLEYLGVADSMKSFCRRFGEQHAVTIDFTSGKVPNAIPLDASLSLMRVLQEGLHNATKHSGVNRFQVKLFGAFEAVHLTIHDSGVGFNPQAAMQGQGVGLISMRERLKLVNGELSIESQSRTGSTIHASVPLAVQSPETPHAERAINRSRCSASG